MNDFVQKLQAAVDAVVAQGQLSKTPDTDRCYYRYPGNHCIRCVAGHLIPDHAYSSDMEGSVSTVLDFFQLSFSPRERDVIRRLQHIHDGAPDVETFAKRARAYLEGIVCPT